MSAVKTALAVVVLSMVALTACGTTSGVNGGAVTTSAESGDPEATMRTRPSFEDAQRQYRATVEDWATQIASTSTGLTWRVKEDSWGGCTGEYADTPGVHAFIYVVFDGPIPDTTWPSALDVVRRGAAQLGATDVTATVNRPDDHNVIFSGNDGITVEFGTKAAGVLSAKSDCRLRQADMPGK
ncbi:LppA family lipoprotein [Arthrobacter sp. SLBN-53]|uniref:LppA family lipoprotein n=1 Tax=Arthrobacter sp. SLBN-53 TaxID=2768412 RepID=UPI0011718CCA|nr:LppA family lipoprotein [Arthrobacter sp. SLBN-53]TQK31778.1 putative LppA-like lipoprotein [Arthrobacter sp. SLBN-53]